MKKLFWIALGATAGVLIVRKINQTAHAYSPEGLAGGMSNIADAIRDFADAVRESMHERETELRVALGVDTGTMTQEQAQALLENPTDPGRPGTDVRD